MKTFLGKDYIFVVVHDIIFIILGKTISGLQE